MSTPGISTRLDHVPGIWDADAYRLVDCGLETVSDLVVCVADEGLTALSERSGIPQDQLRTYLDLAKGESSRADMRWWGGASLVVVALVAAWLLYATTPLKQEADRQYAAFYDGYVNGNVAALARLDTIIDLYFQYDSLNKEDTLAARERLDLLTGMLQFDPREGGDNEKLTPQFASLLNLGAAADHRALELAKDTASYDEIFRTTERIYRRLEAMESHRDYARPNLERAEVERAVALYRFGAAPSPEAGDSLRKHLTDSINSAFGERYDSLSAVIYDSLTTLVTGSMDSLLAPMDTAMRRALTPIQALVPVVEDIDGRLAAQTSLLEAVRQRLSEMGMESPPDPSVECPAYTLLDEAMWREDLRGHFGTLEEGAELVTLELQLGEEGEVMPGGVEVISSSNPRLNTAVAGAAEDFRFEVPEGCNKLRYDILFRR